MGVVLAHFSYWAILWLLPRTVLAINQEHVINGKLDPKWSDYIASLVGDYSEDVQPATEPKKRQEATPQVGWSPAGMGEAPYLAVVYSEQAHQHRTTLDFDKAGSACGGALITVDKVITLCACVASWWMFHLKGIWDPDGKDYRFSEYNIKSKYLHVAHTKQHFDPQSLTSKIIPNKTAIELQSKCTQYIEGKGHPIEQQVIMVILEMQTPVDYPIPGQYIPWPPAPILHDSPKDSPANIITFGMRSPELPPKHFYNDYGEELLLNMTAVTFRIKKVFVSLCATEYAEFSKEIQFRSTCFYPEFAPKQELCQGLIGSPVIVGSNFQGLLATPVGCYSQYGELVVLNFVKEIKELIEKFAGVPKQLKAGQKGVYSLLDLRVKSKM
uniref:Trypsin n=1 Tax=Lygus hesperus TaxID=30085 RepID=A0A0A9YEU0_LYGHE